MRTTLSVLFVLALGSCGPRGLDLRSVPSPTGPGSGEPNLVRTRSGRAYLTWVEPVSPEEDALRFARWQGDAWSEPHTVASGSNWFVNWADFPSLVELANGTLVAHWLQQEGEGTYAYGIRLTFSHDAGVTWTPPMSPHDDGTLTEHGFVSLVPWQGDGVLAVWLDGRRYADTVGADGDTLQATKEMQLRAAHFSDRGEKRAEWIIDDRVCDCCQTTAVRVGSSVVVSYRDRSVDEIRDIYVSRFDGEAWSRPTVVAAQGWEIPGCPVNGPRAAVRDARIAIGWYAAPAQEGSVSVAFSDDAGLTFGPPIRVDEGEPLGRVDVALRNEGDALVSWMESDEEGNALLKVRRVAADGTVWPPEVFGSASAERASGFPQMERVGSRLLFAWTVTGDPSSIHTAVGWAD